LLGLLFACPAGGGEGGLKDVMPERGTASVQPARRWEDGFVTGNGRMGVLVFGQPAKETIVGNHCRLFLPLGSREIVPDLAQHLPELRSIIRGKGYGEAMKFFLGKAKAQGFPGLIWTDPFHPGFFLTVEQPAAGVAGDHGHVVDAALVVGDGLDAAGGSAIRH
jgi:hypothetical protein